MMCEIHDTKWTVNVLYLARRRDVFLHSPANHDGCAGGRGEFVASAVVGFRRDRGHQSWTVKWVWKLSTWTQSRNFSLR
jgi:hypothetical protein